MIKLGEIAKIIKGISYRSSDYTSANSGVAFVNLKCVDRNGGYKNDGLKYYGGLIKDDQYVKAGDILIANTDLTQNREVIGSPIIVPSIGRKACFSLDLSKLEILRSDIVDKRWLYYYLRSNKARQFMISHSNGSTVAHLSIKDIPDMEIDLPDLATQKKIADTLSTFDDKIELNRQMNETLEEMGRALFRHYFIDNPEAKNWPKRRLGEFFDVVTGKKDANYATSDGKYPFFTCAQTISRAPTYSFDGDAILLAGNGDFNVKIYSGKFEAYQRTYVLIPYKSKLVGFLYYLMNVQLQDITGGSQGSVIRFITKGMIDGYSLALPDDDRLLALSGVFNNIVELSEYNNNENFVLVNIRDSIARKLVGR